MKEGIIMSDTRTQIQARYDAKNRKSFAIKLNKNYDKDIISKLESVESINGYIRQLIREDIARTCSDSVPVSLSDASLSILTKKSAETGISVPDLIAVMVNEQLIRIQMEEKA